MIYDNIDFELDNDKFNRYLLYKYIRREYLKNGATEIQADKSTQELIKKHSDNLFGKNGLSVSIGRKSLEYFCMYYLQDTFIPKENNLVRNLAQVHLLVWKELEKMFIADLYDKEEFILPRGIAKSTIINKALSCFLACYELSPYTIVIGNKSSDSESFIGDTRVMLENPYIVKSFGKLIDKRNNVINKQELELTNYCKIMAFSWGSSVRGTVHGSLKGIFRPSTIILDDILSEDDILNDNAKLKVINKFTKEVSEVGDTEVWRNGVKIKSASKILIIGTPLASDDFVNYIQNDATFKVFHRKVCNFDVDEYFENHVQWQFYRTLLLNDKIDKEDKDIMLKEYYTKHKSEMEFPTIWEKYQCDVLAQKYFTSRIAFMQELQCDSKNVGVKWFKSIRKQTTEEINEHNFDRCLLICDPASSTKDKSDYSAIAVLKECDANGFTYVPTAKLIKLGFIDLCKKICEMIKDDKQITHVSIEKNLYMGTDVLKIQELMALDDELSTRDITFINKMQRTNKDEKIMTCVDSINNGQIIFNEDDKEYTDQILLFQGQKYTLHDDGIDNIAQGLIDIMSIETIGVITLLDRRLF
ncbi:hypothetical protein [Clostridium lacusfryxellense]|uniref:hypothetical protein n=1 Tax=Clostridium lacusfryxellense TaxID=205328 RepID=UPI001C0C0345|nr:hypothetical protein [Clostridium lacusfryxellense]MBU3112128.1 hypothetical protein [Clostridium lacusfryxellense]